MMRLSQDAYREIRENPDKFPLLTRYLKKCASFSARRRVRLGRYRKGGV